MSMTNEEAVESLTRLSISNFRSGKTYLTEALTMAIKALEQQQSRDMEEIKEIMECDTDAETKCKMISNILTAKPHYFEKQDSILDKIRAEIESKREEVSKKHSENEGLSNYYFGLNDGLKDARDIIDIWKKMTEQKMKPCPKCKSTNVNATCWGMWKAWCRECLFEIDSFLEEKDAIEAWNNLEPQAESEDAE